MADILAGLCRRCQSRPPQPGSVLCGECAGSAVLDLADTPTVQDVREIIRHDFPVDIYPHKIATFVRTFAAATPSPLSWVGAAVLNVAAAALGSRRRVVIKDNWTERSINWTALVGESGSRKTPTLAPLTEPLHVIERKLITDSRKAREEYNRLPKKDRPPNGPGFKQFAFTDITFEALVRAVANGKDFWGEFDELSAFLKSMGQYKPGGGSDRDHWVSLWSSGLINYTRVRDSLRIYETDVHASLIGGVQPPKLRSFRDETGDGLEYRFNYSGGAHIPLSEAVGVPLYQDWYGGCIQGLWDRMTAVQYASEDCFKYLQKKEKEYLDAGVELGIATKALTYIARHTLPLHGLLCIDEGRELPYNADIFERAGLVQDHFVETWETEIRKRMSRSAPAHEREVTTGTVADLAEALWRRFGRGWISRSKIMQNGYAGLDNKRKLDATVTLIRELGEDCDIEVTPFDVKPQQFRCRRNPNA